MTLTAGLKAPLSEIETREILENFHRDGFALVRGVFGADEVAFLRRRTDELVDDPTVYRDPLAAPPAGPNERPTVGCVLRNPQERDLAFAELFIREPILSLVRAILGPEARFCGQNVIRNPTGQAISHWHVDDKLEHPLPPEVPRWDARVRLLILWLSVQVPLSDITDSANGPTEVVRGSQYSGRTPPKADPVFEGRAAEPIFCRAGDIYLFNHQVWHRGSPNRSPETRYLMQLQYARGDDIASRFQGAKPTPALQKILENADPELVKLMIGRPREV